MALRSAPTSLANVRTRGSGERRASRARYASSSPCSPFQRSITVPASRRASLLASVVASVSTTS